MSASVTHSLGRGTGVLMLSALLSNAFAQALTQPSAGNPPPGAGETAGAAASGGEARPASSSNYVLAGQVDWIALLPAPPAAGSPAAQADLQTVLDAQRMARQNPTRRQQAIDDSENSCFRFDDVLGKTFDEKKLPKTAELLKKATADAGAATGVLKAYWKRPRPYVVSTEVEKLADMDPVYVKQKEDERKAKVEQQKKEQAAKDAAAGKPARAEPPAKPKTAEELAAEQKKAEEAQKEKDNTSYPSGHATMGTMCALVLIQLVPEKQRELNARAALYRDSRLIVGAHHKADVAGGELLATAVATLMTQNFAYQRDAAAARIELRKALGLPADLPARDSAEEKKSGDKKTEAPK